MSEPIMYSCQCCKWADATFTQYRTIYFSLKPKTKWYLCGYCIWLKNKDFISILSAKNTKDKLLICANILRTWVAVRKTWRDEANFLSLSFRTSSSLPFPTWEIPVSCFAELKEKINV